MQDKEFDVVVIGELNPDLILTGDITPSFGQVEKLVEQANLTIGSSAAIFACGAARLGLRVAFIGLVGKDMFGQFILQEVAKRGVDTHGVMNHPSTHTGLSVILNRRVDRAILTYPGTIPLLSYDQIDLAILSRSRHLHLGSYYLLTQLQRNVPRLFREAHSRGLTVSIDTNYDPSEGWDAGITKALKEADVFLPNETELLSISHTNDLTEGMKKLKMLGPTIVVKQGAQGASLLTDDEAIHETSIQVNVVDTVGAGDTFDAGFIYGFLQNHPHWPACRSLRFACICGALSTRGPGGTSTQPTQDEVNSFFA